MTAQTRASLQSSVTTDLASGQTDGITAADHRAILADLIDSSVKAINDQTGTTYTLALTDAASIVRCANAGAITVTVPLNATVAFPIGSVVVVTEAGAGTVTLAAAGGVTLNTPDDLVLGTQWESATLRKVAADVWDVGKDVTTAGSETVLLDTDLSAGSPGPTEFEQSTAGYTKIRIEGYVIDMTVDSTVELWFSGDDGATYPTSSAWRWVNNGARSSVSSISLSASTSTGVQSFVYELVGMEATGLSAISGHNFYSGDDVPITGSLQAVGLTNKIKIKAGTVSSFTAGRLRIIAIV